MGILRLFRAADDGCEWMRVRQYLMGEVYLGLDAFGWCHYTSASREIEGNPVAYV